MGIEKNVESEANPSAPPVGAATGVPAAPVEGQSAFVFDGSAPLEYERDADGPVFLGATVGHSPINLSCGKCNYRGPSLIRKKRGTGNIFAGILTLGLLYFLPGMDTHHYCPNCDAHVAVAKLF
ncbi:hypothetical protein BSKO_08398 [Bryopsis sp. KO-2023]|nr:hypothetical protein BSKO_08398 [Bryopsis sp. KO-2023]